MLPLPNVTFAPWAAIRFNHWNLLSGLLFGFLFDHGEDPRFEGDKLIDRS
jgi:hypothetical protein